VPLALQPGERVRVLEWSEILATLDEQSSCQGLGWMSVMRAFCGTEQTVLRRVERFFDERTRRMLRIRDVVLLEGVHCRPSPNDPEDYAGCARTCLLFWKEAWLERLPPPTLTAAP
jgi:hypothetical protein